MGGRCAYGFASGSQQGQRRDIQPARSKSCGAGHPGYDGLTRMQTVQASRITPSLQHAFSLLLQAAADRLGLAVDLYLADTDARHSLSSSFSALWSALELMELVGLSALFPEENRARRQRSEQAQIALIADCYPLPGERLGRMGRERLAALIEEGAFAIEPDAWQKTGVGSGELHAQLGVALQAERELFGNELSIWLAHQTTRERLVELWACLLEHAIPLAGVATRAKPALGPGITSESERAAVVSVWEREQERALVSYIAPTARASALTAEDVQFSVFRPREICPDRYFSLLAFVHLESKRADAAPDEPEPAELAQRQAEALLGGQLDRYKKQTSDGSQAIARASQLTFSLTLPGVEVTPRSQHVVWVEDVHHVSFQLRATASLVGQTAAGELTVFAGPLIIGCVPIALPVVGALSEQASKRLAPRQTASMYRKIFASYAHADASIVQHVLGVVRTLGDRYLMDATDLRSGERWTDALAELIREANVFQLFWSERAMYSSFVRAEYEFALSLGRSNFVRPTYWDDPMPESKQDGLPPPSLAALHFARLPLESQPMRSTRSVERMSPAGADSATGLDETRVAQQSAAAPRSAVGRSRTKLASLAGAAGVLLALGVLLMLPVASPGNAPLPQQQSSEPPAPAVTASAHIISIVSQPAGAEVYSIEPSRERSLGRTPLEVHVEGAARVLELRLTGYAPYLLTVTQQSEPMLVVELNPS